jgi:hypothetical protein
MKIILEMAYEEHKELANFLADAMRNQETFDMKIGHITVASQIVVHGEALTMNPSIVQISFEMFYRPKH